MPSHSCGPATRWRNKLLCRLRLKCDGTRVETTFRLSAKRASPLKSAGASVQSTTGRRCVRVSGSNAGYTMFRGSVKGTGYPLHSPVSFTLPHPHPRVSVCHHISTGLYHQKLHKGLDFATHVHRTQYLHYFNFGCRPNSLAYRHANGAN